MVTIVASGFKLVILTYGRIPIITRRIRAISFEDFFARSPDLSFQRDSQTAIFVRFFSVSLCRRS